eukprot:6060059-Alexandrium_andersonii.AAC.1
MNSVLRDPDVVEAELRAWEKGVPASLGAQPREEEHPMLAPAQVTAQVIVDSTMSWIEQYHQ